MTDSAGSVLDGRRRLSGGGRRAEPYPAPPSGTNVTVDVPIRFD